MGHSSPYLQFMSIKVDNTIAPTAVNKWIRYVAANNRWEAAA